MDHLLTVPEELFLLTVNDQTGRKAFLKSKKFDLLLSAAILMDLALHNRIDTDLEFVIPNQPAPTGHRILDLALEQIQQSQEHQKTNWWLLKLAEKGARLREILVSELLAKGLLRMEREHVFLGFSSNKYPTLINDQEVIEVKSRVKALIFSKDLPDFRDVVIISIAWYGGLLDLILTEDEIGKYHDRIEQLARMDLIGQAVSKSLREATQSIVLLMRAKEIFGTRSPEEKLEELVEELKALMHIDQDKDMPEWLRKGGDQYQKTLDYIRKTGTNEIIFNSKTGKYGLKAGASKGQYF
ncbi:MAG: GPP34 family phosphoprotein [Bacteroidetes bacterium]|nr:GPP34 family phosphoprotein [Bacteroidota bacterium]